MSRSIMHHFYAKLRPICGNWRLAESFALFDGHRFGLGHPGNVRKWGSFLGQASGDKGLGGAALFLGESAKLCDASELFRRKRRRK